MECSSLPLAASSDWQLPLSRPVSQQHAPHRAQSRRHQGREEVQQYNSQWMHLLQGTPEMSPEPQSRARTTDPNLRVPLALSAQGQQQHRPVLQPQCEELHYQRLPASAIRAMAASAGGVSGVDGASFRASAHMAAAANVSGSSSGESSILLRWDGEASGSSDGTYRSTTTGITVAKGIAASPRHGATAESIDDVAYLADLQRRVEAQAEGRRARRAAAPEVGSVSAARVSSSSWTPSWGCPTRCSCCSDTPGDNAAPMSAVVHRKSTKTSCVGHSNMQRITSAASRRGAYIDGEVMAAQDMSCYSEASSETGTTPVRWSSDEGSDDLCSSCRHRCQDQNHPLLQLQVTQDACVRSPHQLSSEGSMVCGDSVSEGDSLCSACQAAARARAVHRRDMAAPCAHPYDPFIEAVRTDALCPEVPPLLYLNSRGVACTAPRGIGDAATRAHRERADRRQAYIQSAAALVAGAEGHGLDAGDGVDAVVREPERNTQSTQTEATVHPETIGINSTTTALSAEVALPLLQDELASLEARTSAQQQARIDAVTQQMRTYHEEAQRRAQELIDLQVQHRQLLELQHLAHQEEARATRSAVARVDCGTSPMETALATETDASTQSAVLSPVSQRHAVGTQHSDNALELLAVARTEAASWMVRLLLSLESEWRSALLQDEAESRDRLLHVVEGPSRLRLLRCQEETIYWRQECAAVAQRSSFMHESRELALSERLARQELAEEAAATRRDLVENLTRQQYRAAEAFGHLQMTKLKAELAETQLTLSDVTAKHADTLEHARQLRVQLVHALRMPTVTLLDRSMTSTKADDEDRGGGAAAAASAYAYATASAGTEDTGALGTRGCTGEGGRHGTANALASSSVSDTGLVPRRTVWSGLEEGLSDLSVHRRFARAHQEALRVTRAQCRTV